MKPVTAIPVPQPASCLTAIQQVVSLAWNPVDRTPQPKPPKVEQPQPDERDAHIWRLIGRLEAEIEDLRQQVARLNWRYVSSLPGDDEADDSRQDLETAGNIVCMPGIRLADVLQNGGVS
jgi:hypothetical protein